MPPLPTPNPRYHGKPLLRLLECYVLWAIGELPAQDAVMLQALAPKLQATYKVQGEWHVVLAAAVNLPRQMPDLMRATWRKNQQLAARQQQVLTPQQFAELFVDANFAKLF